MTVPLSTLLFNIVLQVLTTIIRDEKKVKKQIGKEEATFSILVDDKVLYIRDSQNSTRELLEMSNTFSKTAAH